MRLKDFMLTIFCVTIILCIVESSSQAAIDERITDKIPTAKPSPRQKKISEKAPASFKDTHEKAEEEGEVNSKSTIAKS